MKLFSPRSLEHLLFPLHKSAYLEIERQLQTFDQAFPGALDRLCRCFELNFANASSEGATVDAASWTHNTPAFDVCVSLDVDQIKIARKSPEVRINFMRQPAEFGNQQGNSNHMVVSLTLSKIKQFFIVPLPLVLATFEARVCKPNTYQVYEHNLIRNKEADMKTYENYVAESAQYIGITSRTWQERAQEHSYAARRGSYLLFHRALRGDLFDVYGQEHIVLRAGLSRSDALRIEEIEVEERTLNASHPNGLNMIPGGEAGLRFLSSMTKRAPSSINLEKTDDLLEAVVNSSIRQHSTGIREENSNEKLASLWRNDIQFRIRAITSQAKRLSHKQIMNARIFNASGWSLEKILTKINGIDNRTANLKQLQRLLDGKTYPTIPHVLF